MSVTHGALSPETPAHSRNIPSRPKPAAQRVEDRRSKNIEVDAIRPDSSRPEVLARQVDHVEACVSISRPGLDRRGGGRSRRQVLRRPRSRHLPGSRAIVGQSASMLTTRAPCAAAAESAVVSRTATRSFEHEWRRSGVAGSAGVGPTAFRIPSSPNTSPPSADADPASASADAQPRVARQTVAPLQIPYVAASLVDEGHGVRRRGACRAITRERTPAGTPPRSGSLTTRRRARPTSQRQRPHARSGSAQPLSSARQCQQPPRRPRPKHTCCTPATPAAPPLTASRQVELRSPLATASAATPAQLAPEILGAFCAELT